MGRQRKVQASATKWRRGGVQHWWPCPCPPHRVCSSASPPIFPRLPSPHLAPCGPTRCVPLTARSHARTAGYVTAPAASLRPAGAAGRTGASGTCAMRMQQGAGAGVSRKAAMQLLGLTLAGAHRESTRGNARAGAGNGCASRADTPTRDPIARRMLIAWRGVEGRTNPSNRACAPRSACLTQHARRRSVSAAGRGGVCGQLLHPGSIGRRGRQHLKGKGEGQSGC